jgi:hypothetical protein
MSTGVKTHRITDPNDDTRFVDVDPYVIDGIPRFSVTFNPSDNGIDKSLNASSATDNGTGDYTFNYTNSFGDNFYNNQVSQDCVSSGASDNDARLYARSVSDQDVSHGAFQNGSSNTFSDPNLMYSMALGNLA